MSARRAAEVGGLLIGLAVFGYVGWDGAMWDARFQFGLHLAAVVAVGALLMMALRGAELPRTRIDLPILGLLAALGIATLSAWNPGLSGRALAGIIATTAMLPVALVALRHRPGWTALVVSLPIIGLSVGALAVLAWRRVEWLLVGGPGLPPVRLGHEGTPFGSVAVPPFVILAALPLVLLIPGRWLRVGVLAGLLAVGVPLTLLSGSRSAWIAIAVSITILAAPRLMRLAGRPRLPRRLTPGVVAAGLLALAAGAGAVAFVAPRLTDVSSLVYRGYLWRDTLRAWSADPLFGIGPGAMPWARQAAAPAFTFPVRQPHSHDIPLGILGDAGLVGLAAAMVLVVAFVIFAGPWRQRSLAGRASFAVLAGLAAGMLFEDLTFLPNFNLLVVLLAAVALSEAGAVRWHATVLRPAVALGAAAAATALLLIMALGDAAAVAYRAGLDAAGDQRWPQAQALFQRSVNLDPWQPTGPKSLAVAAERAGDARVARTAAQRAVELNPGDGLSWTNLAILCREAGDRECARVAADRAVETASAPGRELANAALTYQWLGDRRAADRTYRLSLLTNLWTGLTLPWPRAIDVGDGRAPEIGAATADLNVLIGRRVVGEPIDPLDYRDVHARLLAHAMTGDRQAALAAAAEAIRVDRASPTTWELVALVRRHFGLDVSHELAVGEVARGEPLADGPSQPALAIFDIASFRGYPADGLVSGAERLLPDTPWPWVLEPLLGGGPADGG